MSSEAGATEPARRSEPEPSRTAAGAPRTEPRSGEDDPSDGRIIVVANLVGTVVFAATAISAAVVFSTTFQWIGAITAMVLFAVGVATFLWSYYNAAQRSRYEEISVTQLYLLMGDTAPPRIRWRMWGALAAQSTVALATALSRSDGPDGRPGSSLAVGVLVPMLGFGLNGLWAAFHGRFDARTELRPKHGRSTVTRREPPSEMPVQPDSVDKNADHG